MTQIFRVGILFFALSLVGQVSYAGMTVSDPTSYIYYMQQMMQEAEGLANQAEQIEISTMTYEQAVTLYNSTRSVYKGARSMLNRMSADARRFENNPSTVTGFISHHIKAEDVKQWLDDNGYVDTEKFLVTQVPDASSAEVDTFEHLEKQEAIRYQAAMGAIKNGEDSLNEMSDDFDKLTTLVNQIEEAEEQGEKLDLNNHFLAEMLFNLQQIKSLLARLVSLQGFLAFDGSGVPVDPEEEDETDNYTPTKTKNGLPPYMDKLLETEKKLGIIKKGT